MEVVRAFYRVIALICFMVLCFFANPVFSEISNPYYSVPVWKVWYDDPMPAPEDETMVPPSELNWLFLDDSAIPGQFIKYRNTDWPQRKYAGFWYDVFSSRDIIDDDCPWGGPHAYIHPYWTGFWISSNDFDSNDGLNDIRIRHGGPGQCEDYIYDPSQDAFMTRWDGSLDRNNVLGHKLGVLWTTESIKDGSLAKGVTDSFADIEILERDYYFANVLRATPTASDYQDINLRSSLDNYDALVPVFYNSFGASGSESMASTKMLIAGGYLPRQVKPELLRHGLLQTAMLPIWKASLPYAVPYDHELKHRIASVSFGDGELFDSGGSSNVSRNQVAHLGYRYDPGLHLENMVKMAKGMTITPPIAIFDQSTATINDVSSTDINGIDGIVQSINKTVIRARQGIGETVAIQVSVAPSYDLQGLPLDFRWKVLNGNKNTTVQQTGSDEYLITVPPDDNLPEGRTVVMLIANNGFYDSNPATVNIYRPNGGINFRLPPISGLQDRVILPGEPVSYTLQARDSKGYPVSYSAWQGVGEFDGNVFTWDTDATTSPADYPVKIIASDGNTGAAFNHGEAVITVSNTVAEITATPEVVMASAPVNFSSAGSRVTGGGAPTSYAWDFDDGTTPVYTNDPSPTHTFTQPGFYQVKLTVDGVQTASKVIEVKHNWPLAINNGWDNNAVDAFVWAAPADGSVSILDDGSDLGPRLRITDGGQITSAQTFDELPVYIEAIFRRDDRSYDETSGFNLFGSLLGNTLGTGYLQQHDMKISNTLDSQFIGPHIRDPLLRSELKLYVENDPNNPGKIRYRGYVDADIGRYFVNFDNQDSNPAGWFNNIIGASYSGQEQFDIWRFQVFAPVGLYDCPEVPELTCPEINVEGENLQNVFNHTHESENNFQELHKDVLQLSDDTEFRYPDVAGGTVTRNYTIRNQGTANLVVNNIYPTGDHAAEFSVDGGLSFPIDISPGGTADFSVTFDPGGSDLRVATINVDSNDADEAVYSFNVRGWERTAAEINVQGNGANIASGTMAPNITDHTDFGKAAIGEVVEREFIIHNLGLDDLSLSASVTGSGFSISKPPRITLEGLESTVVKISFESGRTGLRTARLLISSNDSDESIYWFDIQGTGVNAVVASPALTVDEGATADFDVQLLADPGGTVNVSVNPLAAGHLESDVTILSAATLSFTSSDWHVPQTVTIAAAEDETDTVDGMALIQLNANNTEIRNAYVRATEIDNDITTIPLAKPQTLTVDQYCTLPITLTASDGDRDPITFVSATSPANGNWTGTLPNLTYTANAGYLGSDSFTFIVNDGASDSDPGLIVINVISVDTDGDGLADGEEKCLSPATDPSDPDSDDDGLTDYQELNVYFTDPNSLVDDDGDGLSNDWETAHGTNLAANDAMADADDDGFANILESFGYSDPNDPSKTPAFNTIHVVAGTNTDCPEEGSIDCPYNTISAAIDAASSGDTIQLAAGSYVIGAPGDILQIKKSIAIVGPENLSTTIDSWGVSMGGRGGGVKWGGLSNMVLDLNNIDFSNGRNLLIDNVVMNLDDKLVIQDSYNLTIDGSTLDLDRLHINNSTNIFFDHGNIVTGKQSVDSDIYLYNGSNVSFTNFLFEYGGVGGEAFWVDDTSHLELVNGTVIGFPVGVRIVTPTAIATVRNTIFDTGVDAFTGDLTGLSVSYSLFDDDEAENFIGSNGNLTGDPLFVDPLAQNYRLQGLSPAVDTGDPNDSSLLEGPLSRKRIDMGVHGNTLQATPPVDNDDDGMPDGWENAVGLDSSSDDAMANLDGDAAVNILEYFGGSNPDDASEVPVFDTINVDTTSGLLDAINAASLGDTIQLAAGTYDTAGLILSKPINIVGPTDLSATISDGNLKMLKMRWGRFSSVILNLDSLEINNSRNITIDHSTVITGKQDPYGDVWLHSGSSASFSNNLISYGGNGGEAFWVDHDSHLELVNNTVVGYPVGVRIGLYQGGTNPGTATVRNTIFDTGIDAFVGGEPGYLDGLSVSYSLFDNGGEGFIGSNGNLTGDPLFVDPLAQNYRLQGMSPAVDTGDPNDDYSNEPGPYACRINMGAYGNTASATSSGSECLPDLVATQIDAWFVSGTYNKMQIQVTTENIGNLDAGDFKLFYWLSLDQTLSKSTDIKVPTFADGSGGCNLLFDTGLAMGDTDNRIRNCHWAPTAPGSYYVIVEVDPGGSHGPVTESNEGNNSLATSAALFWDPAAP